MNFKIRAAAWIIFGIYMNQVTTINGFSCRAVLRNSQVSEAKKQVYVRNTNLYSSIGEDPEEDDPFLKLPEPNPPEDPITLSGDILAIFIYTYVDHEATLLFDSLSTSMSDRVPVWFNPSTVAPFGNIPLSLALPIEHHYTYTPAIGHPGLASVLMAIFWIFSSIFTGALRLQNTQCDSRRALLITTCTWLIAAAQLAFVAWASDGIIGNLDAFHKSLGLTRADYDYLAGSLSVLLFWRFTVSNLLGDNGTRK